jgi:hypothetical protein
MPRYRIMYESEFREKYGDNWRNIVKDSSIYWPLLVEQSLFGLEIKNETMIGYIKRGSAFNMLVDKLTYSILPTWVTKEPESVKHSVEPKYRIKTLQELVHDIGKNWRAHTSFIAAMDMHIGQVIPAKYNFDVEHMFKSGTNSISIDFGNGNIWLITDRCITQITPAKPAPPKPAVMETIKKSFYLDTPEVVLSEALFNKPSITLNQNS